MLNQIKIASLKVYSFHGCNKEERDKGGFFTVDVEIDFDFTASAEKDDLSLTLDYAKVAELVKLEMEIPSKLIETVTKRILDKILLLSKKSKVKVERLLVRVTKLNPPLDIKTSGISSVIIYKNI